MQRPTAPAWPVSRLTAAQVNVVLAVCLVGVIVTGVVSWAVGTGWSHWWTTAHGVFGLSLLVLSPAKSRRSVRTGLRRRRPTRYVSLLFGVLVTITIVLGVVHSTGVWSGVGYWSPLWTHFLAAAVVVVLFAFHVFTRPVRLRQVDLDRRMLLGAGAAVAASAVTLGALELAVRAVGSSGGRRRFTGSHEVGSFDPASMPKVIWINDSSPDVPADGWPLRIGERTTTVDQLRTMARPVEATIDCTGGWYSTQRWDAVPLSDLVDTGGGRSLKVTSATGYSLLIPMSDASHTYLAVGYGGQPLQRGHGAPVRLVAPSRRGPWWVKWVVSVEPDDRPWWFQPPFPLS